MNFIQQLDQQSDPALISSDLAALASQLPHYEVANQIGLTHSQGAADKFFDSVGSIHDRATGQNLRNESDFGVWSVPAEHYTRQQVEQLAHSLGFGYGRVRYMRLKPRSGLTVHRDDTVRYHFVLSTNPHSYFANNLLNHATDSNPVPILGTFYHIPADGHWYRVDTRRTHWVYNGGTTDRIHLVISTTPEKP